MTPVELDRGDLTVGPGAAHDDLVAARGERGAHFRADPCFDDQSIAVSVPGIERAWEVQTVRGRRVDLAPKEFDLLQFLASTPRRAYSRQVLLEKVWQSSAEWQQQATVTEHIRKLRTKIEDNPAAPRWICTVRNMGYRFDP